MMLHKLTSLKWKHWLGIFLLAVSIIVFKNIMTNPMERKPSIQNEVVCRVYYLLNIDGMKGLGYSALLLQDSSGQAAIFSYNGMQYNLPHYQIYTHNCDTAARELLALINEDMKVYNENSASLTPGRNYRNMCKTLGADWGLLKLGKDSMLEKILSDY